jgi:hypothetical protein
LVDGEVILSDRVLPGTQGNIDFVVVAPSGIWVIDAKKRKGEIEYKPSTFMGATMELSIDGKNETAMIDRIYNLVIPVRQLVPDWSVSIQPALLFVDGDWSDRSFVRLKLKGAFQHGEVWIGTLKTITKKIKEPGSLTADDVARLGAHLDQVLPPR